MTDSTHGKGEGRELERREQQLRLDTRISMLVEAKRVNGVGRISEWIDKRLTVERAELAKLKEKTMLNSIEGKNAT